MSNSFNEKLNKTFQLLSEHKLTIIIDVSDDYKCGICKNIINNAHQAICGCNFCLECISQFIENGGVKCPGISDECKSENLSNIVINHSKNIQISKMIVKCPNENCYHECNLIKMEDHLRLCLKNKVKCPFYDLGCQYEIVNDKLNEHFIENIDIHSKIFIESISDLRNDVRQLKESDARFRTEIELLKDNDNKKDRTIASLSNDINSLKIILTTNDKKKDELINSLQNEINLLKQTNQEMKTSLNNSNNVSDKLDEMEKSTNDRIKSVNDEMESMKQANHELKTLMKISNNNLWNKLDEMDNSTNEKIKSIEDEMESMKKLNENMKEIQQIKNENEKTKTKINEINKFLNMRHDGVLWREIGKINEIKWMGSDCFYDRQNPYHMDMILENRNKQLNFRLRVQSGLFDEDLKWPMQITISIHIRSLDEARISKAIKKSCRINKPKNNSSENSDIISFSHEDLEQDELMNVNCELYCFVKFN